jgi:integrase
VLRGLARSKNDPKIITLFLADRAEEVGISALEQDLAAIRYMVALSGQQVVDEAGYLKRFLRGMRRDRKSALNRKRAISPMLLSNMIEHLPEQGLKSSRDRAALLLGYSLALRRSEIVTLDWEDIVFDEREILVRIKTSKNQSTADFQSIPKIRSELCAFAAMQRWASLCDMPQKGPCFPRVRSEAVLDKAISDRYINRLVKRLLMACGMRPDEFGAHSLRSGFASSAHWLGLPEANIRDITRHKSAQGLLPYLRPRKAGLYQEILSHGHKEKGT